MTGRGGILAACLAAFACAAMVGCGAGSVQPGMADADSRSGLRSGVGLVEGHRIATRPADRDADGYYPLAYWVDLKADPTDPASRDVLLYVHAAATDHSPDRFRPGGTINVLPEARTEHDPRLARHLLAGRRLSYRGRLVRPGDGSPAYVDTAVAGGHIRLLHEADPVSRLAEFTIGRRVVFEGVVQPRKPYMGLFKGERWRQDWHLIVTLADGQTVDVGDRFQVEHYDFRRCVGIMRQKRAVRVRVVGQVFDAAPVKARAVQFDFANTPRDVRGLIVVGVEELALLGDEPAEVLP